MYLSIRNIKNNKFFSFVIYLSLTISFIAASFPIIIMDSKKDFFNMDIIGGTLNKKDFIIDISTKEDLTLLINFINNSFIDSDVYLDKIQILTNFGSINATAVNLKDNYYWKPFVYQGSFFEKKDKTSILLGNETDKEDLTSFINNYHIKGVISRANTDIPISRVYFPIDNLPDEIVNDLISVGYAHITIINPTNSFSTELNNFNANLHKASLKVNNKKLNTLLDNGYENADRTQTYYLKFIIVSIISGISVITYWIYKKQKELALKKILGASNLKIFLEFYIHIFLIGACSLISVFILLYSLSLPIHKYLYTYRLNVLTLHLILLDFLFFVFLTLFISLLPIRYIVKVFPSSYF